jgi:hypothetical protein
MVGRVSESQEQSSGGRLRQAQKRRPRTKSRQALLVGKVRRYLSKSKGGRTARRQLLLLHGGTIGPDSGSRAATQRLRK